MQYFGKSIDTKHLERVFEKFHKVPDSDPTRTGTGLGLAISKDIITSEGGKIRVDSEIGKGSKFSFQLKSEANP